MLIFGNYKST